MSLDELRSLPGTGKPLSRGYANPSFLTDEEWTEVLASCDRGVPTRDIYETFASKRGYRTLNSFRRSIDNRKNKHGK